jgi:Transposase, Mutator family
VCVRLEEEPLCLLVLIGVRSDGTKELITLAEGLRESTGSWADLLRDARRRGMRAPVLAVGDDALGFWAALREVFPDTRAQRCWFHKITNVPTALPKSAQPGAKRALAEIWNAEDKDHAMAAVKTSRPPTGRSSPRRSPKSPATSRCCWRSMTYRPSTGFTCAQPIPGPGSKAAGLAMAFKLIEAAQVRWRAVNAPHLVALVRAGARFERGLLVEREVPHDTEEAA